jgi:predicted regulator of Ras-like GTPase activity (Roadblock/LC7/MglB family)
MQQVIPDQIRGNNLAKILDDLRRAYGKLSRIGRIYGLAITDQDAKVLAVNSFFDNNMNYWDIGAIGAALYGVSNQAKDFFNAGDLERASLIYNNNQFFVHSIGRVSLSNGNSRELILIIIGDRKINVGLVIMQMKKFVNKIRAQVEEDEKAQSVMQMSEKEFLSHITDLKKELFNLAP